jgi:hypothetical protein
VGAVNENLIEGKVIMRIPWIRNIAIIVRNYFGANTVGIVVPLIVVLIILLIAAKFILPAIKKKGKTPSLKLTERPEAR